MRQAETRTFWTATSTWVPFSDLMVWGANWKEQIKTILFLHSTPGQQQQMSCALIVPFTSRMLELSRSSYYFNVENSKEACKHKSWWDIWKSRMWIQIWFAIADYCYLCFVLFFFFESGSVSIYGEGWLGTLKPSASISPVLGLQVCMNTFSYCYFFSIHFFPGFWRYF